MNGTLTDDAMLAQLLEAFGTEADENLCAMEQAILQLERSPEDMELARVIFRAAHSIKGDASCVGRTAVADCAHALEDLVERVTTTGIEVDAATTATMLRAVDALRSLIAAGDAPIPAAREIVDELRCAAAALGGIQIAALEAAAGATATSVRVPRQSRPTLRVDIARLDRLLDLTGEITVARGRMEAMLQAGETNDRLLEVLRESDRLHAELHETVSRARMVPLGPLFRQFARTVHDVSSANAKFAELTLEGEEVEVDTNVVEHLRDPLTHMIRNAIDHGIESPDERQAMGKNVVGRLTLASSHDAGTVIIRLGDDGRGLDTKKILSRARLRGIVPESALLSDKDAHRLIFDPGFSTADVVTELSGRGLGMDIVRRHVESLRGRIDVASVEGAGTTFTIRLPLTLAIIDGFEFRVGSENYIVPLDMVVECIDRPAGLGREAERTGVLNVRGEALPYLNLEDHFHGTGGNRRKQVVVVHYGEGLAGLAVDSILGECQAVIKPLSSIFTKTTGISGTTILGSGRVALILDVAGMQR